MMILFFGIYHVKWNTVFDILGETAASVLRAFVKKSKTCGNNGCYKGNDRK
jgi:hypothetical protein